MLISNVCTLLSRGTFLSFTHYYFLLGRHKEWLFVCILALVVHAGFLRHRFIPLAYFSWGLTIRTTVSYVVVFPFLFSMVYTLRFMSRVVELHFWNETAVCAWRMLGHGWHTLETGGVHVGQIRRG